VFTIISVMRQVYFVMKEGKIHRNDAHKQGPSTRRDIVTA
jgi:hypothetical protein